MVDADKGLAAERVTAIGFEIVSDSRYICRGVEGQELTIRRMAACWNACLGIPTETLEAGVVVVPVSKLDGALHDLAFEVMTRCVKGRTTILVDRVDQAIAKCKAHLQQNGGEGR